MTESKKQSVLIIDDDNFLLDIYTRKFKESGHDIRAALSGEDGLAVLRGGFVPSVIIVDLVMPGMDGYAILDAIRAENLRHNAAIVILSNQSQKEDISKAIAAGADGYIVKANTTPSEVLEQVLDIARKKH